jgi:hypothetical protein
VGGNVRLREDRGPGRVDSGREVQRRGGPGRFEQRLRLVRQRDGVEVDDAEEGVVLFL